jgi:hypothetical protein
VSFSGPDLCNPANPPVTKAFKIDTAQADTASVPDPATYSSAGVGVKIQ